MFKIFRIGHSVLLAGLLVASAGAAFAPVPASAAQVCGDRAKMVAHLGKGYRELPAGIGLTAGGAVIELFTAETGSWTILMTMPGGRTCVTSIGEGWERTQGPKPVMGEAS